MKSGLILAGVCVCWCGLADATQPEVAFPGAATEASAVPAVTAFPAAAEKNRAAPSGMSPLILNISKDGGGERVAFDYSIRWDFSDLRGFKPGVKMLRSIFRSAASWDITENTRVKYYGFKTNPWRVFVAKKKPSAGSAAGGSAGAGSKRRLRLSLSPLVDNFKKDLDENIRDALLSAGLKRVSPELSKLSAGDRKIIVGDVLSIFATD